VGAGRCGGKRSAISQSTVQDTGFNLEALVRSAARTLVECSNVVDLRAWSDRRELHDEERAL
jgi:hypothetical protein